MQCLWPKSNSFQCGLPASALFGLEFWTGFYFKLKRFSLSNFRCNICEQISVKGPKCNNFPFHAYICMHPIFTTRNTETKLIENEYRPSTLFKPSPNHIYSVNQSNDRRLISELYKTNAVKSTKWLTNISRQT